MQECCKWQWVLGPPGWVYPIRNPDGSYSEPYATPPQGEMVMWWPGQWHKETDCPCSCPALRAEPSQVAIHVPIGDPQSLWVRWSDGRYWQYWRGKAAPTPGLPFFDVSALPDTAMAWNVNRELPLLPVEPKGFGKWVFWVDPRSKQADVWKWHPGRLHSERDCDCRCPIQLHQTPYSGLHFGHQGEDLWAAWYEIGDGWVTAVERGCGHVQLPRGAGIKRADDGLNVEGLPPPKRTRTQ